MEETQTNIGQLEIGTMETEKTKLEAKPVKIVRFRSEHIEKAKSDKVIFEVEHPDREEVISISAVSVLAGKQVMTTGTWLNTDSEGKLLKDSQLVRFIVYLGCKNLEETIGKEVATELDEKGYLCFKAY